MPAVTSLAGNARSAVAWQVTRACLLPAVLTARTGTSMPVSVLAGNLWRP